MSATKVFFAALLGMCWSWCTAQAQGLYPPANVPSASVPSQAPKSQGAPTPGAEGVDEGGTGLSSWIVYDRHDPTLVGGGGPPSVVTEGVVRVGPSRPIGGEFLGRVFPVGWMIEGGARSLFFNHTLDWAWAAEITVSNTNNQTEDTSTTPFPREKLNVSLRALNRTFANLGFGNEWYPWQPANAPGCHLRLGADLGLRYGAGSLSVEGLRHRIQVMEGFYGALHSDLEIPWGRWTYVGGLRMEYGFTRSNILEGRSNMQDLNMLISLGARY